jgi:hypothetical protein
MELMYLQLFVILAGASALALWCGWGLSRLGLPPALRPYSGLLSPLLGYALVILIGYLFVWTITGLLPALIAAIVGAGVLNVLAWRRGGPPRVIALLRSEWPLLVLLLVTLLIGIAPLLHYGHWAIIGGGWDIETALPTVRYLERGPISAIRSAPMNPLRDLVSDPPRIGKTLGFALWQGQIDLLTGIEAILTFVPLMAWMRALGVLAVYVMLRATFALQRPAALLGAAWASAGALLLWIIYFNFEKQISAWALIPLGLVTCVAAVEYLALYRSERRAQTIAIVLVAALTVAAQIVAYYAAMTLWVPLAVGLAIGVLAEQPLQSASGAQAPLKRVVALLGAALVVGLTTIVLSIPALIDYWRGFAFRYDAQITTLGVFRYIPFSDIVGTTPYAHGINEDIPVSPIQQMGTIAIIGLIVAALLLPTNRLRGATGEHASSGSARLRWVGLVAGGLLYLAWLRWGEQYPYAYMKGASYAGFVFVGGAAAGCQALFALVPSKIRMLASVVPLLLFVPLGMSQARIVADHWERPGLYPNDFPALLELRQLIPAGSTVMLDDDARTEGVISGLASYMLDHTTVLGRVKTGYTSGGSSAPDALGDYALLPLAEDPSAWGYGEAIWQGGSFALYQRPTGALANLRLSTLLEPGAAQELTLGAQNLALGATMLDGGPERQLTLLVASLEPTTLEIDGQSVDVAAGGVYVSVGATPTGRTISVRNSGNAPFLLRAATLAEASTPGLSQRAVPGGMALAAQAHVEGTRVTATVTTAQPQSGPTTVALDIWDTDRSLHHGWYGVELAAGTRQATFELDVSNGALQVVDADGAPLPFGAQFDGLREGKYRARLQVSAGAALLASPGTLFEFEVSADGAVGPVLTLPIPLAFTTVNRPPEVLHLQVGSDTRLLGYALDRRSARPGEALLLTLWWQALDAPGEERSVLVHLLDAQGTLITQADGAPARGGWPTSLWRSGDTVLDSRNVALPPDLPVGDYTLAFGIYRWPSLERLPLRNGDVELADAVVRVPITITR